MEHYCYKQICNDVIHCLVQALEAKDSYTSGHSTRVGDMAHELALYLDLDATLCEKIHIAGHLHDIGKIGVPDLILNKKGSLSSREWKIMKEHPQIGYEILIKADSLVDIAQIIKSHHERWDGLGYPDGLKGEDIPLGARIIAICDTIDAITSIRPYRGPFSWEQCWKEILDNSNKQFDPDIISKLRPVFKIWEKRYKPKHGFIKIG